MALVIAHRTLPRDAPENSLLGIRAAAAAGADAVEVDVRLTRDGVPVLMHDACGLRTAWQPLPIRWVKGSRLRRWRLRGSAEAPPTFARALEVLATTGLKIAIDTKAPDAGPAVTAELERAGLLDRALLWSQHEPAVRHFAAFRDRAADVALLRDALDDLLEEKFLSDAVAFGAQSISAHQRRVSPEFIERCRNRGLRVHTWFQDRETQRDKAHLDLAGIVTDWPQEALSLLGRA